MSDTQPDERDSLRPSRPLAVAAVIKQVPGAESLTLGPDGRLRRHGLPLEMNPYCRRAVSKAVEVARASGGRSTILTLGPPEAEDVLREAVAWGADEGVHVTDPAFAGSDTFATARALAAALEREGPFDLVLVGRNSIDGETGQVGPELAELLDLPFATGARHLRLDGEELALSLELDDGWQEVRLSLPALISVAERLCEPCKVDPEGRRAVPADRLRRLAADELGAGPWGEAGSPTRVGAVRLHEHHRAAQVLEGDLETQARDAVALLRARGALAPGGAVAAGPGEGAAALAEEAVRSLSSALALDGIEPDAGEPPPVIGVVAETGRAEVTSELVGAAGRLAMEIGAQVVLLAPSEADADPVRLGRQGVREVRRLVGATVAEDVAGAVREWATGCLPWLILAPSTSFGREVAGRVAASLEAGLVGDAIGVDIVDGELVAAKPAFAGALVADIRCTSAVSLVTVRPGALAAPGATPSANGGVPPVARVVDQPVATRGRVKLLAEGRDDDVEVLARAEVVIGVGTGVQPSEYPLLEPLAEVLGAEMAASRKVTDRGWMPRARQVGITGRSIAPRLYVAVGLSGKFNHMSGVRAAGTVLAINAHREAPVFSQCDIGIVGDWREAVRELQALLSSRQQEPGSAGR